MITCRLHCNECALSAREQSFMRPSTTVNMLFNILWWLKHKCRPFHISCKGVLSSRSTRRLKWLLAHTDEPSATPACSRSRCEWLHCCAHSGVQLVSKKVTENGRARRKEVFINANGIMDKIWPYSFPLWKENFDIMVNMLIYFLAKSQLGKTRHHFHVCMLNMKLSPLKPTS